MGGDRPRSGRKGVIPCSCNLALGGASWYSCVRGLSASTALQEWGLARGCPPCLRRRRLPAVSKIGEVPRFNIQTRGWTKGGQCSPHSWKCSSHTPPRWGITTRSGGPRCRTGSGVSLVSPRGTTMSSCHPARLWPSSTHDRTAEPLASLGWALTAAFRVVQQLWVFQSHCPPCTHRDGAEWSHALGRRRAGCSLHPACGRAWTLRITLHHQLV